MKVEDLERVDKHTFRYPWWKVCEEIRIAKARWPDALVVNRGDKVCAFHSIALDAKTMAACRANPDAFIKFNENPPR